ncbi:molybdate ABC transporter substrate-binding protein [Thermodesulfatator autotrophicus]|uniref:Molybdate ABC transporter substrate-binding protein n=1 Tax=Thermodesulfatator autotrophicus TaxID=1795632 RepID=A0A177E4S9_9BACT|nr:molybdate ABC transporter substrate-binding protein [Thermodesulfatator autotrophicus]OAG26798.1 hypothetical protein TH606_10415 [Thermodesulfatator autotrophicus]
MLKKKFQTLFVLFWLLIFFSKSLAADSLQIAAAANLLYPFQELAKEFEKESSVKTKIIFGSSGKLLALLEQGAPFDVFFSADAKRPEHLYQKGLCFKPVTYALGVLVFWTEDKKLCKMGWPEALKHVSHLAIANPKLAPYGEAAILALKRIEFLPSKNSVLLKAPTVSQAFQWAESGNAEASLIALSLALSPRGQKGCFLEIPEAPLIKQKACVLKGGHTRLAEKFLNFTLSHKGKNILAKYGYK